ncbi:MAG: hypothetical protein K0S57_2631 [Ramlibacter sp.]|jgi:hypothetical protein|nr:hypothetical protein [Ramlibacter sp.]
MQTVLAQTTAVQARAAPPPQVVPAAPSVTLNVPASTQSEIAVRELPKLVLDSPTDWLAVLSFLITAIVVLGTTWLTIRNYQKTIDLQDRIAKKSQEIETTKSRVEILSKNRQDWINTLRNTISEYVSVMLSLVQLKELRRAVQTDFERLGNTGNIEATVEWNYKVHAARTLATQLRVKIRLLSNPREEDFVSLLKAIDQLHDAVDASRKSVGEEIEAVITTSQKILKSEWERVKNVQ